MSYSSEEKFDLVYQKLSGNYDDVLNNMRIVSDMIKKDKDNVDLRNLLFSLAEVATKIIGTQISFVYSYAEGEYLDMYVDRLNEKRQEILSDVATDLYSIDNKGRGR